MRATGNPASPRNWEASNRGGAGVFRSYAWALAAVFFCGFSFPNGAHGSEAEQFMKMHPTLPALFSPTYVLEYEQIPPAVDVSAGTSEATSHVFEIVWERLGEQSFRSKIEGVSNSDLLLETEFDGSRVLSVAGPSPESPSIRGLVSISNSKRRTTTHEDMFHCWDPTFVLSGSSPAYDVELSTTESSHVVMVASQKDSAVGTSYEFHYSDIPKSTRLSKVVYDTTINQSFTVDLQYGPEFPVPTEILMHEQAPSGWQYKYRWMLVDYAAEPSRDRIKIPVGETIIDDRNGIDFYFSWPEGGATDDYILRRIRPDPTMLT